MLDPSPTSGVGGGARTSHELSIIFPSLPDGRPPVEQGAGEGMGARGMGK